MQKGGLEILQLSGMTFKLCMQQGELVLPSRPKLGLAAKMVRTQTLAKNGWSQKERGKLFRQCHQKSFIHSCWTRTEYISEKMGRASLHTDLLMA